MGVAGSAGLAGSSAGIGPDGATGGAGHQGAAGAAGPAGGAGSAGAAGSAGPAGSVASAVGFAGTGGTVPSSTVFQYQTIGPYATITVPAGGKLLAAGTITASCATNSTYGQVSPYIALCAFRSVSRTIQSGGGVPIVTYPNVAYPYAVRAAIPVTSGSWNVGFCIANNDAYPVDTVTVSQITGWAMAVP